MTSNHPELEGFGDPVLTQEQHQRTLDLALLAMHHGQRARSPSMPEITRLNHLTAKIASDCQLRCYVKELGGCYMYPNDNPNLYKQYPPFMSPETFVQTGRRVGEHALRHSLEKFGLTLHGGEPLLVPDFPGYVRTVVPQFEEEVARRSPNTSVWYGMMTNGLKLAPEPLDACREVGIRNIGVSVDGGQVAHDRNRRMKGGTRGSFEKMRQGLRLLQMDYRDLYGGTLTTIDLRNDPTELYHDIRSFDPPWMDFALPDATHVKPPFVPEDNDSPTPYGEYMSTLFNLWWSDKVHDTAGTPDIGIFTSIISLVNGGTSRGEDIGPYTGVEATIQTDGSIDGLDSWRMASEGMLKTGMDIYGNDLEQVEVRMRTLGQLGLKPLPDECQSCSLMHICGGGSIVHQYDPSGKRASVYSKDLAFLIGHIRDTVGATLRSAIS